MSRVASFMSARLSTSSARRPSSAIAAFCRSARHCSVTSWSCEKKYGSASPGSTKADVSMASTTEPSGRT